MSDNTITREHRAGEASSFDTGEALNALADIRGRGPESNLRSTDHVLHVVSEPARIAIDEATKRLADSEATLFRGICEANRRPCDENRQALVNAHRRIEDGLRREMALEAEVARLRDAGAVDPKQVERLKRNLAEALEEVRLMREERRTSGYDAGKWLRDLELESDLEKAIDARRTAEKQRDDALAEIARLQVALKEAGGA